MEPIDSKILYLIFKGYNINNIAYEIEIPIKTVRKSIDRIYKSAGGNSSVKIRAIKMDFLRNKAVTKFLKENNYE
jgi:DNA-binding NarL/FixJ family response regulator